MGNKKTIAVDIDDVLAANAAGFAAYSNKHWGSKMTEADYDENWLKAWGVPLDEAVLRAEQWHKSEIVREYASIEHALPVLGWLKDRYRLVIVTSRRITLEAASKDWMAENFPDIFSEVHFAGIWDNKGDHKVALNATKTDVCQAVGADYLIDDQLKHCIAASDAGIDSLLFGEYAWNRLEAGVTMSKNVVRVGDWNDVLQFFKDLEDIDDACKCSNEPEDSFTDLVKKLHGKG